MGNPNLASSVRVPEEEEDSNALLEPVPFTLPACETAETQPIESNSALYWLLMLEQVEV
jgi:hypothetical protein